MDKNKFLDDVRVKMQSSLKALENDFKGLRTGRASTHLLDPVQVDSYGNRVPISQVATVSTADARTLIVQVWDKSLVKSVEKAITEANLGFNPASEGQYIRLPIPPLSEERRKELVKLASKYGENTKIALRNIRRSAIESLKTFEKNNEISKDDNHKISDSVQKILDENTDKVDSTVKAKEKDIMTV